MNRSLVLALALAIPSVAAAQPEAQPQPEAPPQGPRDVIEGARQQAADARRDEAMGRAMSPQQRQRQTAADRMAGRVPPLATAVRDPAVPAGTIRVQVVDVRNQPVVGQRVRVGVMRQAGSRDALFGETDDTGIALIEDLSTGSDQAYRVAVTHQGATYGAPPFRLEADSGHSVRIRRLDTTTETRMLLQVLGQTHLEYRDGRLHITEQTQLTNLGDETIIFGDGMHYPLPVGFMAFQSPAVMTDQRVVPDATGFMLKGSVPPGTITLNWAYDLPLEGGEVRVAHDMPFRTYAYRVFSDAAPEMRMTVEGFPPPEVHMSQGRRMLISQLERTPEDSEFDRLVVTVTGIPTAGPLRWLALGGAFILLLLGFLLVTQGGRAEEVRVEARKRRKKEILDAAVALSEAHGRGEVGPKYHARRMGELVSELASLLRLDDAKEALAATEKSSSKPSGKRTKPSAKRRKPATTRKAGKGTSRPGKAYSPRVVEALTKRFGPVAKVHTAVPPLSLGGRLCDVAEHRQSDGSVVYATAGASEDLGPHGAELFLHADEASSALVELMAQLGASSRERTYVGGGTLPLAGPASKPPPFAGVGFISAGHLEVDGEQIWIKQVVGLTADELRTAREASLYTVEAAFWRDGIDRVSPGRATSPSLTEVVPSLPSSPTPSAAAKAMADAVIHVNRDAVEDARAAITERDAVLLATGLVDRLFHPAQLEALLHGLMDHDIEERRQVAVRLLQASPELPHAGRYYAEALAALSGADHAETYERLVQDAEVARRQAARVRQEKGLPIALGPAAVLG
ncbi:MAG: hypothetical protein JJ863_10380 [Deltaproteobacteria bacterium]|nr:hypothetical protein [Deltaproteobacteria bacterium]